ncbi:MAG: hypothetical protein Q4B01_02545 [Eubacteriales bacterium]|nr:hypothetical protein [Eubacteriales bacterium]
MQIDRLTMKLLNDEIPILTREIRNLYAGFDRKYRLNGAKIPITFGFDTGTLGSYTQGRDNSEEEFHFSLLFIARGVPHPLTQGERLDLYKHEYAHYMQYNMPIPKEYTWQYGTHGSAWKYCCSLVGAAPTPYYKVGEDRMKHDYEKVLKHPIHDKTYTMRDNYRRETEYKKSRDSVIQYQTGEVIQHPTYGEGEIIEIRQQPGTVRLHIRFGEHTKIIDQKWLLKTRYK